jgi:integrase
LISSGIDQGIRVALLNPKKYLFFMSGEEKDLFAIAESLQSEEDPIKYQQFAEYYNGEKADGTIIQYMRYLSKLDFNPLLNDPDPSIIKDEDFSLSDLKRWANLKATKKECDNDRFRYNVYISLKNYLDAMGETQKISELPPSQNIPKPDSTPPSNRYSEEEIKKMMEETEDDQLRLAIIHMFYAGMRSFEILHIRPSWYSFSEDAIEIKIPAEYAKGKKSSKKPEYCFLPKKFEEDIKDYIKEKNDDGDETGESIEVSEAEEEPLFNFVTDSNKDFKALARERYWLTKELQDLAIECGIEPERKSKEEEKRIDRITPHRLRKSFVHHIYEGEDGLNLSRTSRLARHENTDLTDKHYLNIEKQESKEDYQKVMG